MHAPIATRDSPKLATFNVIPKLAAKEKRQSIARVKRSKLRRQLWRGPSTQNIPLPKKWLDQEAKRRKIHLHNAACGHGGERFVERFPVDGYDPKTRTVYQYHGCY